MTGRAMRAQVLVVVSALVLTSPSAFGFDDCRSAAPVVNKQGFRPGATIPYAVGVGASGNPFPADRIACVDRAFEAWTQANRRSGLHVRFVPGPGGIIVRFDRPGGLLLSARKGGGWSEARRSSDGFLERATIWLSTNPRNLDSCDGLTKLLLHEVGHLHGLADTGRHRGPSVMNRALRKNDSGGSIPWAPTRCDAQQALYASTDPEPMRLTASQAGPGRDRRIQERAEAAPLSLAQGVAPPR